MYNLKPCPFCGNTSTLVICREHVECCDIDYQYQVVCDASCDIGCGASSGYTDTITDAVKAWNRRETE